MRWMLREAIVPLLIATSYGLTRIDADVITRYDPRTLIPSVTNAYTHSRDTAHAWFESRFGHTPAPEVLGERIADRAHAYPSLEDIVGPWQHAAIVRMHVIAPFVEQIADTFDVDPATIHGIVLSESGGYPDLVDGSRRGLLQYTDEEFAALIRSVPQYTHEQRSIAAMPRIWDPEANLQAYHTELRLLEELSGISDPIELHLLRASRDQVSDRASYLSSTPVHEQRERIEGWIREAHTLLNVAKNNPRYQDEAREEVSERLIQALDTLIGYADARSGEARSAYLTSAVSYARVLNLPQTVHRTIQDALEEDVTRPHIELLERRLREPLR